MSECLPSGRRLITEMTQYKILLGDCLEHLEFMPDNSVDSIVTDPPYGLAFMGKRWDYDVPSIEKWAECLRVLKPGGHLLAFFGTRTYHRGVVPIEDAGFEVRDQIGWAYGSGFPKSHNGEWGGTALKPAWEPICVARKPLIGTIEANWREHGTGALNVDACRVPTDDKLGGGGEKAETSAKFTNDGWKRPWMNDRAALEAQAAKVRANVEKAEALGRWPANLIHDGSEDVLAAFPQAAGQQGKTAERKQGVVFRNVTEGKVGIHPRGDNGSAARFFYCAKASKQDRDDGLDALPTVTADPYGQHRGRRMDGNDTRIDGKPPAQGKNNHPTVKPTDLMRYLCRLVTPPGGLVLDPFMGSGSTGKAAMLEGFRFIGIEREADYVEIARNRILAAQREADEL